MTAEDCAIEIVEYIENLELGIALSDDAIRFIGHKCRELAEEQKTVLEGE